MNEVQPPPLKKKLPVDRLRWYRDQVQIALTLSWMSFVAGVLLCVLGCYFSFVHQEGVTHATIAADRRDPGVSTFWFGMALVGVSTLLGINHAIRECHLEEAERARSLAARTERT